MPESLETLLRTAIAKNGLKALTITLGWLPARVLSRKVFFEEAENLVRKGLLVPEALIECSAGEDVWQGPREEAKNARDTVVCPIHGALCVRLGTIYPIWSATDQLLNGNALNLFDEIEEHARIQFGYRGELTDPETSEVRKEELLSLVFEEELNYHTRMLPLFRQQRKEPFHD